MRVQPHYFGTYKELVQNGIIKEGLPAIPEHLTKKTITVRIARKSLTV
jgi:hypothetical protein